MEKNQAKIVARAYWKSKISNNAVVKPLEGVCLSSHKVELCAKDLQDFNSVTDNNTVAEYTVLTAVYFFLIKKYFSESFDGLIFSTDNEIPFQNPFLLQAPEFDHNTIFKQWLRATGTEVENVSAYIKHSDERLQDYGNFGLTYNRKTIEHPVPKRLYLTVKRSRTGLDLSFLYDKKYCSKQLINSFSERFCYLITHLCELLDAELSEIPLLSESEKQLVLHTFNDTQKIYEGQKTITALVEEQVAKTPEKVALVCKNTTFTYQHLNENANQLAHFLRQRFDVQPDEFVAVKLERNEHLIIAILGILKSGAAYVPLDLNYPQQRIDYIEKDSNCNVIIDSKLFHEFLAEANTYSSDNPTIVNEPEDLAYLIYTSGSTGNPKGVMIMHKNAFEMIQWAKKEYESSDFEICYASTSHCFDLSVYEMFFTLSFGKTIRLLKNALEIKDYLPNETKVLLNTVPSVARKLIEEGLYDPANISVLNLAGEVFPVDIVPHLFLEYVEVRNLYGPSEDTTYSTYYQLRKKPYTDISIGKPLTNTQAYLLDEVMNPVPAGAIGKLFLAGEGVARGYLNMPELTAEKFLENPFIETGRMYDTGDLAKWQPDGNLTFLGRKDHQVKLHGYRIELGEIEHAMQAYSPSVKQVVVDVKNIDNEAVLVAYYISETKVDKSELRTYLGTKLPAYMIPNYFVNMHTLPLTPNGKVDRKALPTELSSHVIRNKYVAPQDKVEAEVLAIWKSVLEVDEIGVEDHFFELGGHSLMIAQIINRIFKTLGKRVAFKAFYSNPTVRDICKVLKNEKYQPIAKVKTAASYPATAAQHRLWILSQFEAGAKAYEISGALQLKGTINTTLFAQALTDVVKRHEILRTYFEVNENGLLEQFIVPAATADFKLVMADFSKSEQAIEEVENYISAQKAESFDLSNCPLLKAALLKTGTATHIFFLSMHHIIADGWSLEVLRTEVLQRYFALLENPAARLPELPLQFKDYAHWLTTEKEQEQYQVSEQYWLNEFEGILPVLELPGAKKRPLNKTYNGDQLHYSFSESLLLELKRFTQQQQATLFMTLMAGVKTLLARYSQQEDIVVGIPVAGRKHPDLEQQIGLYLNTLAIRTQLGETDSFEQLLEKEKTQLLGAYTHQDYPFNALVEQLEVKRDKSRSPLFDIMVVLHNQQGMSTISTGDLSIENYPLTRKSAQFDLTFNFVESEGLSLEIDYNTDIYEASFIQSMFRHLENIFRQGIENPTIQLEQIELVSAAEKKKLLEIYTNTTIPYENHKTLVELFESQADRTPEKTAVLFENKNLSYRELQQRSNELANYLLTQQSVKSADLVGIKLERNEWMLISILAVLKTGAAYVPIDPNYPAERIAYIESDSNCQVTVTAELLAAFEKEQKSDKHPGIKIAAESLAYVIYTSGSTGKPKGVMIGHDSAVELVEWSREEFKNTDFETLFAVTSYCFDLSIYEFFYPLSMGRQLRILENGMAIDAYIETDEKILINTVPSVVHALCNRNVRFDKVVGINMAGEPIPIALSNQLLELGLELRNLYGPSEDTTYSSCYRIEKTHEQSLPIGVPISNTRFYVLSKAQRLQPEGMIGELCISGKGLSKGYLNREALTAEKFIENPYEAGQRMYRTGDLVYWLPDGNMAFIGRKDDQVKVRGYRIELGEIEKALSVQGTVEEAVVLVKEKADEKYIVAYVVGKAIDKTELKKALAKDLPAYMLPNYFIEVEAIPLTPNGKTNKSALLEMELSGLEGAEFVAPATVLEEEVAAIWQEILGEEQVSATADFFELGGHSLMITRLMNAYQKEFEVKLEMQELFEHTTVQAQADLIASFDNPLLGSKTRTIIGEQYSNGSRTSFSPIPKVKPASSYSATAAQHRLWILSQFEAGAKAYEISGALQLKGTINTTLFAQALTDVVKRHEILRTYFEVNENGLLEQFIVPAATADFKLAMADFSKSEQGFEEVENYITAQKAESFDLSNCPLLKAALLKTGAATHIFFLSMHHIIADGWSLEVLRTEVLQRYFALLENPAARLPELPLQFKDYAYWLRTEKEQAQYQLSEQYWLNEFEGNLPVLELPGAKKRPLNKTYNGDQLHYSFHESLLLELKRFTQQQQATLFMTLMAGVKTLLARYSQQEDIVVGIPVAGRKHPDLEQQIGLYLNTLAIRTQLEETDSFEQLLEKEKTQLLGAYTHQDYPFNVLVEQLEVKRDKSRSPLFDIMVVLHNQQGMSTTSTGDLSIENYPLTRKSAQFDLTFNFVENEGLSLEIDYNTDIYEASFIQSMFRHLENIFRQGIENPAIQLEQIELVSAAEKKKLLEIYTNTTIPYESHKTLVDLFEAQADRIPEKTAVLFENKKLSYRELQQRSNELANYLLTQQGVKPVDLVGIKLERNEWMLISILAVLKTGAAYVPIDPNYPAERIAYIESDSNCQVTVTAELLAAFEKEQKSDKHPGIKIASESLAYVIYTSGSTGKPKGVMIGHDSAVELVEWSREEFKNTNFETLFAVTSYCFDLSIYEFFYPLSIGKQLRILENGMAIDAYIERDENILINTVPSVVHALCNRNVRFDKVVGINMAGEPIPIALSNQLLGLGVELRNLYGPSEDTTYSSCYRIEKTHEQSLPIGVPISNTRFYVLSKAQRLQPEGMIGELCISGKGLSKGYLNREVLTAEKFIENPYEVGQRMYRTGDLVYWLPDGNMAFIGRKDDQVKVRGYRIELGEIEKALSVQGAVEEAVVLVKEKANEKYIVAYVVGKTIDKTELKKALAKDLPAYMLPNYFVEVETIPLTPNGKTNKSALLEMELSGLEGTEFVAPATVLEEEVAAIWQEVLGEEQVSVTADFFELGGHSLMITRLMNAYQKEFEVKLEMQELFDHTTVQAQADLIAEAEQIEYRNIAPASLADHYPLSAAQRRIWAASQTSNGSIAYNMPSFIQLKVEAEQFIKAIYATIERHEILRTVFRADAKGAIQQWVLPKDKLDYNIKLLDFRKEKNIRAAVQSYINQDMFLPFDLESGPLLRATLLQIDAHSFIFYYNMHHIISDGWSLDVLANDVMTYYKVFSEKRETKIDDLAIQFKDYAVWEQEFITSNLDGQKAYWSKRYNKEIPKLDLIIAKKRPSIKTAEGAMVSQHLDPSLLQQLRVLATETKTTLFMNLLAAWNILLYRYSFQKDIIIGSPVAGRNHPALQKQIGCYVNTVALNVVLDEELSYNQFLMQVKNEVLEAYRNQPYPFDHLLEQIQINTDPSRSPLFDVMFVMQQSHLQQDGIQAIENRVLSDFSIETIKSKFDLTMYFHEDDEQGICKLVYNKSLFEKTNAEKLFSDFIILLELICQDEILSLKTIVNSLLDENESKEQDEFSEAMKEVLDEDF